MRKFLPFLLVLLIGCSSSQRLRVADVNFGEEIAVNQNLVFAFDRNVVNAPGADWDTARYIIFEPAVPGSFKWTDTDELVFSPAIGFRPATNYKARLGKALGSEADADFEVLFHTPYLQLARVDAFWAKGGPAEVDARLTLHFNYPVRSADVFSRLKVTINEKPVTAQPLGESQGTEVQVLLAGLKPDRSESLDLTLTIDKGLRCLPGDQPTQAPIVYTDFFPTGEKLEVLHVTTDHDGQQGVVRVYTSQTLLGENLAQYVTVTQEQGYWEKQPFTDYVVKPTENGLEITGAFAQETGYTLTLSNQLTGILNVTLSEAYTHDFTFGELGAGIEFTSSRGLYLSKEGQRYVGLAIRNVPKVKVKIAKIYENNLLHFMRQNRGYRYDEGGEAVTGFQLDNYYDVTHYGDVVYEKEIETNLLGMADGARLLKIDFDDKKHRFQGVYVVEVASTDEYYTRATKLLSVTDLGLIVKEAPDNILVFVQSLATAQPVPGATVRLISSNNQNVYTQTANSDGVAEFRNLKKTLDDFNVQMVTAHKGDDFSYLSFDHSQTPTSRFDVGGKPTKDKTYDAFVYGDREVYRPGEAVHLNCVVRTLGWRAEPNMPVMVKVLYPNGRVYKQTQGVLNAEGAFLYDFDTPVNAPTGRYEVELYSGADELLAGKPVQIEEFMPDRLKVQVTPGASSVRSGEPLQVSLRADYLFGSPAANRNYEMELSLKRKAFKAKGFEGFDFALNNADEVQNLTRSGVTDATGGANEVFALPEELRDQGLLEGAIFGTVFDESSRPVHRRATVDVYTQALFYGVKRFDRYLSGSAAQTFPVVAVDAAGRIPNNVYAKVRIVRFDYDNVIERVYGRIRYKSQKRETIVYEKTVAINGAPAQVTYRPNTCGEYEVRVGRPGAKTWVAREFYAYGWGAARSNAFEVDTDGEVDIVADKSQYKTGETANLLFKAPFDGVLLATVEQNDVTQYYRLPVRKNAAALQVKLTEKDLPNVYITATLIRPMEVSSVPLTVAHGFLSLKVDDFNRRLPVAIQAVKATRSRKRETITVQTAPNAELTVAVVDEGILQLKDTPTPDPYGYFYGKRALEVNGYDVYPFLMPELASALALRQSSTGGGGFEGFGRRANPLANTRVKLVSYWSGRLKANAAGTASFTFDLPQFSGALRVMAVAYQGARFGSAEHVITVSDPLIITTALPRFLTPGDSLDTQVILQNTTNAPVSATVSTALKGPLKGGATSTVQIPAKGEGRAAFKLAATGVGEAQVTVQVRAMNETFYDVTDITVRPGSLLQRRTGSGQIAGGAAQSLDLNVPDFMPATQEARLVLSKSPVAAFGDRLKDLVGYPHGCIEQTISKAFPQLYLTDIIKSLGKEAEFRNPAQNVIAAIQKLETMQNYQGAMSYWPGSSDEHWWGSIYAAHFLYEARKAGFKVNAEVQEKLLNYLAGKVNGRDVWKYYRYDDGSSPEFARREIVYSLFVLTLNGRKPIATMNYYKAHPTLLTEDEKYMLASAYRLFGDVGSYRKLLPTQFSAPKYPAEFDGGFSSPLRDLALSLYVLLEVDPDNAQVAALSRRLAEQWRQAKYPSTQENAFAVTALGKMARRAAQSNLTAQVLVAGKAAGTFDGKDLALTKAVNGKRIEIRTSGAGALYYYWEVSGVSKTGQYVTEDQLLQVRRTFLDRNGNPLTYNIFNQNDLIYVKVSVQGLTNEHIRNVVVSDLLPAGFEIENPRLSGLSKPGWLNDNAEVEYLDVRDDRIHFFVHLSGTNPKQLYYPVRAVSSGTFKMGPVSADAMYNGDYRSANGGGTVQVLPFAIRGGL